ncbi:MAG TPA: chorismate-binding protein, partial [Lysobacter sp.]
MTPLESFQQQAAQGHTRIPVVREVLSDLDTPLSVYLKLADGPHTYLFESVEGGERFGRYSIIGLPARRVYAFAGHTLFVTEDGELVESRTVDDPFAEVEALRTEHSVPRIDDLPGFTGGLVGWFGFECIDYIEPRLAASGRGKPDELGTPDILLMLSEELAVFDNLKGRLYLIVHADPREDRAFARAQRRLDELTHRLRQGGPGYPETLQSAALDEGDFVSGFTRDGFIEAVEKSKDYIRAGDIFQVVLSQRLSVPFKARPVDVYRALRALNPSPYMYFLDVGDMQVVGSSPEILVRLQDGEVTVRPIAGTRPRGATPEQDAALEAELLADPKERAEHLMLIDLGRNDVGRVSAPGTVEVGEQFVIERYSHVMHIVSEVTGRLQDGLSYADVLRATFPAGTVSGAPKIRALEVIRELEPIKRNVYAGSIGYIGWHGDADTAIAIRTAVIQDGRL